MGAAGYGIGAVMSLAAARQSKAAYANDAQAAYEQAEMAGIEADQQAINRTAELQEQLSSIVNASAGQGVGAYASPSITNIFRQEKKLAKADISSIKLMGKSKRRQYVLSAKGSQRKGKAAMYTGIGTAAQMGAKAYTST